MHFTDSPRQDWYCNCADGLAVWTSPSGEEVHCTEFFSRDPEAWAMMSALQQRTSGYGLEDQEAHGNHGDGDCGCYRHDYRSAYDRQKNGEGRCQEICPREWTTIQAAQVWTYAIILLLSHACQCN
jgi:hypothetical protein